MGNVKSTLTATITAVDVNSKQPITRDIGSPQLDSAFGQFSTYDTLVTAAVEVTISIPEPAAYCVYVKNLDAANTLSVKWTTQGGVEVVVTVLRPGGVLILWNPSTGATAGITSLKLTPAGNNQPVEYYLGA
jgi:hypothetical protein